MALGERDGVQIMTEIEDQILAATCAPVLLRINSADLERVQKDYDFEEKPAFLRGLSVCEMPVDKPMVVY